MKDEDGKITYDSELVEKSIKKVGGHVELIKRNQVIEPVSRWAKEVVLLLKKNGEMCAQDVERYFYLEQSTTSHTSEIGIS